MKTLSLFVLSVLSVAADPIFAPPDHCWVKFVLDKDPEWVSLGCPTNYPTQLENAVPSTNGFTLMSKSQLAARYRAVGPAFTNWFNNTWQPLQQTRADAEQSARAALLQQIDQLEAECDVALTNWALLLPTDKDAALRKSLRLDQLRRRLGR